MKLNMMRSFRGDQGHIERIRHSDACEPWGYVAPIVAAVVTRATGVRHIYLILTSWRKECGASFFIVLNSIGFSIFGS